MRVVKAILRFLSYLYHGLFALGLFLFGVVLTIAGGKESLRLEMLPWDGPTSVTVLLLGGVVGLVTVVLAIAGRVKILFFLWACVVSYFLVKGYFLGGYRYSGPDEFNRVLYVTVGSFIALIGAFVQMFRKRS